MVTCKRRYCATCGTFLPHENERESRLAAVAAMSPAAPAARGDGDIAVSEHLVLRSGPPSAGVGKLSPFPPPAPPEEIARRVGVLRTLLREHSDHDFACVHEEKEKSFQLSQSGQLEGGGASDDNSP